MKTAIHWFRRDFRLHDNTALHAAAANADAVVGVFIIDPRWFGNLEKTGPFQTAFWLESLRELHEHLQSRNISLVIRIDKNPVTAILAIAREADAHVITYNKEYEPDQIAMDMRLEHAASKRGITMQPFKDGVIFEEHELLTGAGTLYSVFTPYKNAWLKKFATVPMEFSGAPPKRAHAKRITSEKIPTAKALLGRNVELPYPAGENAARKLLEKFYATTLTHYADTRNFPAKHATSHLSAHLSAGTISIRQILSKVLAAPKPSISHTTFISELIWRDFYRMILFNHPHTVSQPFNKKYSRIRWKNAPKLFTAWSTAQTGYPIVDAAMMQLLTTGFMHNRLRMITAMFLTKDLDTHWILGERFFMKTLVDYDQASNVGGWQWSASTGTDAAPYFRIMNPILQSQRFDPDGTFIKQYLPALRAVPTRYIHTPWLMPPEAQVKADCIIGKNYPAPIIDHQQAKEHAIQKFRSAGRK